MDRTYEACRTAPLPNPQRTLKGVRPLSGWSRLRAGGWGCDVVGGSHSSCLRRRRRRWSERTIRSHGRPRVAGRSSSGRPWSSAATESRPGAAGEERRRAAACPRGGASGRPAPATIAAVSRSSGSVRSRPPSGLVWATPATPPPRSGLSTPPVPPLPRGSSPSSAIADFGATAGALALAAGLGSLPGCSVRPARCSPPRRVWTGAAQAPRPVSVRRRGRARCARAG